MILQQRVDLMVKLGAHISSADGKWRQSIEKAYTHNGWFTPEFIDLAVNNIVTELLNADKLTAWINQYNIPAEKTNPQNVGIIMAGNIPLVGFHDFLCAFISGNRVTIKPSAKDEVLISYIIELLYQWGVTEQEVVLASFLKGCDAYITTGSNNSSRYFEYYFGKYPHIIRRNRTSVAILDGTETANDLKKLAADVHLYFGLGCRNVTKIYVPEIYDFVPLLEAFDVYNYLADHHKYKNNYDYQLAILIINNRFYMTNGSIILHEDKSVFSAISKLNYEFYADEKQIWESLQAADVQCVVSKHHVPSGQSQSPSLNTYADGIDTMKFLLAL